jgi:hypothetical protein
MRTIRSVDIESIYSNSRFLFHLVRKEEYFYTSKAISGIYSVCDNINGTHLDLCQHLLFLRE